MVSYCCISEPPGLRSSPSRKKFKIGAAFRDEASVLAGQNPIWSKSAHEPCVLMIINLQRLLAAQVSAHDELRVAHNELLAAQEVRISALEARRR